MTVAFNHLGKMGQLGNQMFQYAATLATARQLGVTFMVPNHDEIFDDGIGNKLRILLFECFDIEPDNVGLLNTENYYQEKGFAFDNFIFHVDKKYDFSLHGFYQSEKYFKNREKEVREHFTFKKHIINECSDIIEDVFDDPICLHIRRGDFLINSANHHNQTLDYYEAALKKFEHNRQVIIFSDDPDWCKEQKIFSSNKFIVSEGNSQFHDLYLMSQCDDFIIANSSFSWWGAWLANKGRVIAPKQWFGPNNAHLDTKDLYCKHWEIL